MNDEIDRFSMDYFRLDGKVAIVTGANMGLGMAYAAAFAKAGADLYIPHFTGDVAEITEIVETEGRKVAFLRAISPIRSIWTASSPTACRHTAGSTFS